MTNDDVLEPAGITMLGTAVQVDDDHALIFFDRQIILADNQRGAMAGVIEDAHSFYYLLSALESLAHEMESLYFNSEHPAHGDISPSQEDKRYAYAMHYARHGGELPENADFSYNEGLHDLAHLDAAVLGGELLDTVFFSL